MSFMLFSSELPAFFLFIIVVFDVIFVLPVLVTLYPAPSRSDTAVCKFLLVPLPFNTSIFKFALFFELTTVLLELVELEVVLVEFVLLELEFVVFLVVLLNVVFVLFVSFSSAANSSSVLSLS